jgi:hypothetical protein
MGREPALLESATKDAVEWLRPPFGQTAGRSLRGEGIEACGSGVDAVKHQCLAGRQRGPRMLFHIAVDDEVVSATAC